MKIKSVEEILDNDYYDSLMNSPFDIGDHNRYLIKEAMKEYAVQLIDLVAEEAKITDGETSSDIMGDSTEYGDTSYFVDKESVLKVKQLIK